MSQTVTDIRTNFNGGELSRRMEGRVDTQIYQAALAEMLNYVPTVEGPAVKRPGTRMIRLAAATASWVSAFVFNRTQAYVIEWLEGKLRLYTNGGRIESDPVTPYEVTVPYTAAEAPDVCCQQNYDRLYMAHRSHAPASLLRTGASTFTHAALTLKHGPFKDGNSDESKTVTTSGTTVGSSVTLTAASAIFQAGHVGGQFRLEAKDFSDVKAWEAGIDSVAIGDKMRWGGKVYEAETAGRTGSVPPEHIEGSEWDGTADGKDVNGNGPFGIKWKYLYDRFGELTITAFTDTTHVTATVTRRLADSLTSIGSWRWAHGAFSDAEGWPNIVTIWNQRLILIKDFDVFGSVVGDFGGGTVNFERYTSNLLTPADLGFYRRVASPDPILWARADRKLIVGTASGEYAIGPINSAEAVSGSNFEAVPQSFYGSAAVWPAQIGTKTLFMQRGARKMREADYDYTSDRYVGANLTVWARHITRPGVKQLAWQQEPEELLHAARTDGQVAIHAFSPEQQIKGWSRTQIAGDGTVLSIVALPATDGVDDEVWMLAELDGVKMILQQADFWEEGGNQADQYFLDFGASYSGAPITHVPGLTHLAGRAIGVLADGAVVPNITVAGDGSFDLPRAASVIHAGLLYTARCTTLRLEATTRAGSAQGKRKKLVNAILRLIDAGVGLFAGSKDGKLDELIRRPSNAAMDAPVPLFNGDTENVAIGGGWDQAGQMTWESRDPLNSIVTAVMPRYELSDK